MLPAVVGGEHDPSDGASWTLDEQSKDRATAADLDVVAVGADAEDGEWLVAAAQLTSSTSREATTAPMTVFLREHRQPLRCTVRNDESGAVLRRRGHAHSRVLDRLPKPLVDVGQRPILWHLMKYYSHYGHNEFILCLGYGAHKIKEFFLRYDEWATNDFVLSKGGRDVQMLSTDIDEWQITFVDTGHDSNVGERLRRVQRHLGGEELFLELRRRALRPSLDRYIDRFLTHDKTAAFLTVPVPHTFHIVHTAVDGEVTVSNPSPARLCASTPGSSCCAARSSTTCVPVRVGA